MRVSRESHPSGTGGDRRRAVERLHRYRRQLGWTCPQLPLFLRYGPRSPTRVYTCSSRERLDLCSTDN